MGKKSVSIETKWMIIGAWQTNTKNNCEIARQFDVSETCVRTTIRNFLQRNDATDPRGAEDREKLLNRTSDIFLESPDKILFYRIEILLRNSIVLILAIL